MLEKDLYKQVKDYLSIQENLGRLLWWRSGSIQGKMESGAYIREGRKGLQDITILLPNGKILLIELKGTKTPIREDQLLWKQKCVLLGHTFIFIRDLEELKQIIH